MGDATIRRTAFIDGKKFDITASLDSALRHIRNLKQELKIWADGICINQTDVEERNIQVQQMGLIYQLARHTIIYLGDSTPGTTALLDVLRSSSSSLETHGSGYMANVARFTSFDKDDALTPRLAPVNAIQLFQRISIAREWPWFRRIWVLQELVLSLDPWIQIGLQRVRWDLFSDLLNFCSRDGSLPADALHRQLSDDANTAVRLLDLLDSHRGLGVMDPRDMIYGHLGVLGMKKPDNKLDSIIQVDYNQTVSELFTQVVLYTISARKGFDIFFHVADVPIEKRTQFPTWVPDWTYPYSPRSGIAGVVNDISSTADIGQLYVSPSWKPQVLCLISRLEGTINVVLDSKPPKVDLKAICESLWPSQSSNISVAMENMTAQISLMLFDRLSEWFKEQGVAPSVVPGTLSSSYYRYSGIGPDFHLWHWVAAHVRRPSQPLGLTPIIHDSRLTAETHMMTALLLGMTDTSGPESFPGEKIAILEDGTLMFVPICARKGDFVCRLCPDPKTWVLRRTLGSDREELDGKVIEYFKSLKQDGLRQSIPWLGRQSNEPYTANTAVSSLILVVEHVNFIGGCRPEPGFPKGIIDKLRPMQLSIFALH